MLGLFCKQIELFLLSKAYISWTISFSLVKLFLVIAIVFFSCFTLKVFDTKKALIIISIQLLACIGIISFQSPYYIGDFNKTGKANIAYIIENTAIKNLLDKESNFEGVFCIVSPTCGSCLDAGKTLNILHKRKPNLDISFILITQDSSFIAPYTKSTNTEFAPHYLTEKLEDLIQISLGGTPCFLYIKDKKIIHRWHGEEFGYPALDWIESGMNP
jgi:hypothetical protein